MCLQDTVGLPDPHCRNEHSRVPTVKASQGLCFIFGQLSGQKDCESKVKSGFAAGGAGSLSPDLLCCARASCAPTWPEAISIAHTTGLKAETGQARSVCVICRWF